MRSHSQATIEHKYTHTISVSVYTHTHCVGKEALHSGVIRPGHCRVVMDNPVWKWPGAAHIIERAVYVCLLCVYVCVCVCALHKRGLQNGIYCCLLCFVSAYSIMIAAPNEHGV